MKNWFKAKIRKLFAWAMQDLLEQHSAYVAKSLASAERDFEQRHKRLVEALSALQAIDVGFRDAGHIVIVARVGKQDIVKILDVKPNLTMREYRELVDSLEHQYGPQPSHWDAGPMSSVFHRGF